MAPRYEAHFGRPRDMTVNRILLMCLNPLLSVGGASAQRGNLPACPSDQRAFWTNCVGTLTFANGYKYVGTFEENKPNGQGSVTFADGSRETGQYKDGDLHGHGIRYDAKGSVIEKGFFAKRQVGPLGTHRPIRVRE